MTMTATIGRPMIQLRTRRNRLTAFGLSRSRSSLPVLKKGTRLALDLDGTAGARIAAHARPGAI